MAGTSPAPVFLALGSNLGLRERALEAAVSGLGQRGVACLAFSSLYLTEPVGGPEQGWFLNQVVRAETRLDPEDLLDACLSVETVLGRVRGVPNGPRPIDVDVLFYGGQVRSGPGLVLPHPRLHERRFVLVPLAEIAPALRHPLLGLTAQELLARCPDQARVLLHAPAVAARP